ncbi:MAG: radical SAM protein, partial [Bacteroidota bacterium]
MSNNIFKYPVILVNSMYFSIAKNIISSKLKKKPYKLNFLITMRCNSKCKHCRIWKLDRTENELTTEEIRKIFKNLPENIFWVSLSGGEPFIREDLKDIIIAAKDEIQNLKILNIPTNGLCQKQIIDTIKVLKNIPKVRFLIVFSIEGPEKINDKIRGISGAYNKTLETYYKARKTANKAKNI